MYVQDVFLTHQISYEFLSFGCHQVGCCDWGLRVVTVTLPVYAGCL